MNDSQLNRASIIHSKAQLDSTVRVGPYAIVDEDVVLGPGCQIGPYVQITGNTTMGASNEVHSGCVIGGSPQDLKYGGEPTSLTIGDHNIFREHVTVNRSTNLAEHTVIGSHNLLMASSHAGHNSQLGNHIIIANGAPWEATSALVTERSFPGTCLAPIPWPDAGA